MRTIAELAYAAGIIDGDGCVSIRRVQCKTCCRGYYISLTIQVGMAEESVIQWLRTTFGGGLHVHHCPPPRRWNYVWALSSQQASELLKQLLPYLIAKEKQAVLGIELQELKKRSRAYKTNQPNRQEEIFLEAKELNKRGRL